MDPELALTHGWSIGEQAFRAICTDAKALSPVVFVEFGSGPSSVRFAQEFPSSSILAIDHSPQFGGAAQQLTQKYGLADRVTVAVRPLAWQWHAGALYHGYALGPFPQRIDVVIVDGPPGVTRRGREASLHQVIGSLREGGRVYLDDHRRPAERRIVRNWLAAYPATFRTWVLPFDHEICVLEKVAPTTTPQLRPSVVVDVTAANLRRGAGWAWHRARALLRPPNKDQSGHESVP